MTKTQTLIDQLAAHVKHGDHLCVICEDPQQRLAAAAQYIADGLRKNEFVMYAADAANTADLRRALAECGVDVDAEIERGALQLPTTEEAYLRDGSFDPDRMYQAFDQAITDALAAGFSGCRFAGEPTWAIDREELQPGLIEFETRLNELFRRRKAAGFCVYDRGAWPASVVRDVLRTHPVAVVDDLVCERNLYYERPDLVEEPAQWQVDWMLSQLRELRTQEARLQIALEAGRLGSWELDLSDDTSVRSLRHDQIFGYDHRLANWGYQRFIDHVLPEDRDRVDTAFRKAVAEGTTWHFVCRIRRQNDGAVRWVEAHGRPENPAGGTPVRRMLGIVSDITERKELEEALREADRRKDQFLATLAHELRNPLAPILNVLQLMRSRTDGDPQMERLQDTLDRQARHLVRLVDDLLEVSRITTGRIDLQQEPVELRQVLDSAIESSQPLIEAAGHRLSVELPGEAVRLQGDSTRLAQVFLNLLNNAAKYTPAGGRIWLTAARERDQVEVRVRDNGLGISKELLPSVFDMFIQGGRTGERGQGGLGIGLPLARQLIELHGGSIEAASDGPGQGSEFVVRLPVLSPSEIPDGAPGDATAAAAAAARVLVVDDNLDAADSLGDMFELLGHEVAVRYDGRSALEAAAAFDPEIAVLDIGLPDIDGYELARRLRALKPTVTLVALTGWGQEQDRRLAREAGFDLHRTKPADPAEILAAASAVGPRAELAVPANDCEPS